MKYLLIFLLCAFNLDEFAFNYPCFERKKRGFLFENVPLCPCAQEGNSPVKRGFEELQLFIECRKGNRHFNKRFRRKHQMQEV